MRTSEIDGLMGPSRMPRATASRRRLARVGVASAAVVALVLPGASVVSAAPGEAGMAALQGSTVTGLREGANGPAVESLQRALIGVGVDVPGGADGVFGPATRGAVVAFQKQRGLEASGVVDAATSAALVAATAGSSGGGSANGGSDPKYVGLAQGAEGQRVAVVQEHLIDLGVYLADGADGVYGPSTTRGVTQFQSWNGLGVTGTITSATARVLGLTGSGAAPTSKPAPPAETNAFVGLKQGASGPAVRDLQQALVDAGAKLSGGVDGQFGPATEAVVNWFQSRQGRSQTGVVTAADAKDLGLRGTPSAAPADTPAGGGSENGYARLGLGSSGRLVKDVQRALLDAGINLLGGADGAFGNATKGAIVLFQQRKGLATSGVVDDATAAALGLAKGPVGLVSTPGADDDPPPRSSSGNGYVGLKVGDVGPRVKEVQLALEKFGFVIIGGADGVFGPSTASTLRAFQSVNGIAQSGVVTEKGASILGLGSGGAQGIANPGSVSMKRFPVQGQCFFGDTWHAPRGNGRLHVGVDIIAPEGKLLYAVVDGEVSKVYYDYPGALAGNGLRIEQPNGTYFTYLHMKGFANGIDVGTKVKAGDVIGVVGNTGSSATAHLHFEIHPNGGAAINPYPYMKAMDECSNTTPRYQQSFPSAAPSED